MSEESVLRRHRNMTLDATNGRIDEIYSKGLNLFVVSIDNKLRPQRMLENVNMRENVKLQ